MVDEERPGGNELQHYQWFRLDNAAKVFPAVISSRVTTVFRLSMSFREPIRLSLLQKSLENIIDRFPYYRVHLRRGLFWYFFETNPSVPKVVAETRYPCSKIDLRKGVYPFCVKAYHKRLAVEFSHMLTDGTGALTFLKSLGAEYLKLNGAEFPAGEGIFSKDEVPGEEEYEYAYRRYYRKNLPGLTPVERAFHIPFGLEKKGIYRITTGIVSSEKIIETARSFGVSISVFLTGLLMDSIYSLYRELPEAERKGAIRILLAVNMRKFLPSKTMRNFTLMVTPEIDPRLGEYTFEEILNGVNHYLGLEVNEKSLARQISRNVGGEVHPLGRVVPRILKDLFFAAVFKSLGEFLTTCSLSNIGAVVLPEGFREHIERFEFIQVPSPIAKKNCSIISYDGRMFISFGRVVRETRVERYFFTKLVKLGVPVKIDTN